MVEKRLFPVRLFRHLKMFTDSKDDKESLTQRALRLEERNTGAASASTAEGERKEESMFESNRPAFAKSSIRSGPGTSCTVPDSFAPQIKIKI